MTGESPWMPRRERDAPRESGLLALLARSRVSVLLAAALALAVGIVFAYVIYGGRPEGIPREVWVAAALVGAGALVVFLVPLVRGRRLAQHVRRVRPGLAVVTMHRVDATRDALGELGASRRLGSSFIVAIGTDALEVWTDAAREPNVVIPYRAIVRATIGLQPVRQPAPGNPFVEFQGSVDFEVERPGQPMVALPLIPRNAGTALMNDDRIEYFVEQLAVQTPLPWTDTETPRDPDGSRGVS
jgi:hypothetical protein